MKEAGISSLAYVHEQMFNVKACRRSKLTDHHLRSMLVIATTANSRR